MTTKTEASQAVCAQLHRAGVKAEALKRGPLGSDIFEIHLDSQGVVRLWAGTAVNSASVGRSSGSWD